MADKIIIFSGKQYSGKDTLAKIMLEKMNDFRRCAMGDIIKLEYGKKHNLTYEEIEKNKPLYRQGLIDLGNWGRAQDADYWLKKIISQDGNIMVTDVRVQHEYDIFKAAGAITIRVNCPRELRVQRGTLIGENDITEIGLDHIHDWNFIVNNDSNLEALTQKAEEIITKIKDIL